MLKWNVFIGNWNTKKIMVHNVFDHDRFYEACVEAKNTYTDKDEFAFQVKSAMMYYYWSKCEWEVTIHHWPEAKNFNNRKIDVFEQVTLNWDRFIDYLWNNREELQ